MAYAYCTLGNKIYGNTHTLGMCNSHCFSLQQWLHEYASILRHKYIVCLEFIDLDQRWAGTVQYTALPVGFPSIYLIQSNREFQSKLVGRIHLRISSKNPSKRK